MGKFSKKNYKERRRYPRIKDNIFILFQSIKDEISSDAMTCDISKNGLRFTSSNFIPESTELELEICQPLSPGKNLFLVASAKIRTVWIKKSDYVNEYLIGAKIIKMNERTQNRLTGYINNRLAIE